MARRRFPQELHDVSYNGRSLHKKDQQPCTYTRICYSTALYSWKRLLVKKIKGIDWLPPKGRYLPPRFFLHGWYNNQYMDKHQHNSVAIPTLKESIEYIIVQAYGILGAKWLRWNAWSHELRRFVAFFIYSERLIRHVKNVRYRLIQILIVTYNSAWLQSWDDTMMSQNAFNWAHHLNWQLIVIWNLF